LWREACGHNCWGGNLEGMEAQIRGIPDDRIWSMRAAARKSLVEYVRARHSQQIAIRGGSAQDITAAAKIFDPNALTLGFARRFATYKRPNLLLHDPQRLHRILSNPQRPVQLVLAGKAHPKDEAGQAMIRQWIEFIHRSGLQSVVFLSDYDMLMATEMVGGVDVWINTPRRPWEASGTSGMKVLVNGGLNLSETDGWWAEAYTPGVGWAIGDGREHGDDPAWDAAEAEVVYALLEEQVIPEFYERNQAGIPSKWVARIRESMARLTLQYSANRAVREYTSEHYIPASVAYAARAGQGGKLGAELLAWQQKLSANWNRISLGPLKLESKDGNTHFEIPVHLGESDPGSVHVELFALGLDGAGDIRVLMNREIQLPDNGFVYTAAVESNRPPSDCTPRVMPCHPEALAPLDAL
jgi:glycogen phosphorylase